MEELKKRKEKDTKKKKESKNKLSTTNGEMDLAEVARGDADEAGRGGPEEPAHCTDPQEGSSDPQDSPGPLEILTNS